MIAVRQVTRTAALVVVFCMMVLLSGCNGPQVYGSIGVSSGFGSHGSGGRMHGSISVGGRIR